MKLLLTDEHIATMKHHAENTYPEECCGVILGKVVSDSKQTVRVVGLENSFQGEKHNRFLITPEMYRRWEKEALKEDLDIIGFYHSHPDSPAIPSEYDRSHAWPWYSYIIISVQAGKATEVRNWRLQEDRSAFDSEEISVT